MLHRFLAQRFGGCFPCGLCSHVDSVKTSAGHGEVEHERRHVSGHHARPVPKTGVPSVHGFRLLVLVGGTQHILIGLFLLLGLRSLRIGRIHHGHGVRYITNSEVPCSQITGHTPETSPKAYILASFTVLLLAERLYLFLGLSYGGLQCPVCLVALYGRHVGVSRKYGGKRRIVVLVILLPFIVKFLHSCSRLVFQLLQAVLRPAYLSAYGHVHSVSVFPAHCISRSLVECALAGRGEVGALHFLALRIKAQASRCGVSTGKASAILLQVVYAFIEIPRTLFRIALELFRIHIECHSLHGRWFPRFLWFIRFFRRARCPLRFLLSCLFGRRMLVTERMQSLLLCVVIVAQWYVVVRAVLVTHTDGCSLVCVRIRLHPVLLDVVLAHLMALAVRGGNGVCYLVWHSS